MIKLREYPFPTIEVVCTNCGHRVVRRLQELLSAYGAECACADALAAAGDLALPRESCTLYVPDSADLTCDLVRARNVARREIGGEQFAREPTLAPA